MPHAFQRINAPIKTLTNGSSQFHFVKRMKIPAITAPIVDKTSPIKCTNVLRRFRSWSLPFWTSHAVAALMIKATAPTPIRIGASTIGGAEECCPALYQKADRDKNRGT